MSNLTWFQIHNAAVIDSPALLVFPERMQQNIQTAIKMIGDANRLRPHVKTHKCAEVARMMIVAGIHKFKCATIAEAEMLGMVEARDVLLAYQPNGPKLERFIQLIKKYPLTNFSCITDNKISAAAMSAAFADAGLKVPVYIDLNIGMNRTGILPKEDAIELYRFCSTAAGLIVKGIHAYDGHITNPDPQQRQREADEAFSKTNEFAQQIKKAGLPEPTIIMSGSPTFSFHCKRPGIECSPGTFIYWDKSYMDNCAEQKFFPAAILLTRVVSLPGEKKICTDLGHKSVAAENELSRRAFFPGHEHLKAISHSEEHLVLENTSDHVYQPGDILYAIPFHICPTVALYESVYVIEDGKHVGNWKNIARDRMISV